MANQESSYIFLSLKSGVEWKFMTQKLQCQKKFLSVAFIAPFFLNKSAYIYEIDLRASPSCPRCPKFGLTYLLNSACFTKFS